MTLAKYIRISSHLKQRRVACESGTTVACMAQLAGGHRRVGAILPGPIGAATRRKVRRRTLWPNPLADACPATHRPPAGHLWCDKKSPGGPSHA